MGITNNVTRLLEARGVTFTPIEYPEEKLGGMELADLLGIDPEIVYKTVVVVRERGKPILAVIPAPRQVNLKKLAQSLGEKKLRVPTEKDAERLTGLLAGGISPLAVLHKGFSVVIESGGKTGTNGMIHISGGQRGLTLRLTIHDLVSVTEAALAEIS